ncbi:peptide MFS transporter [Polyangium aurulentum]|uniref:peptide MFS transporter n=1 Tax=Polyangium aurulentum TaxID=2567896 RepID=UPI0010AE26C1|nr:peptide MFS transporter [Polyangium aurulentum]UQA63429.1 peptide MFS transporter [Polyangium aurulentum]
MSTNAPTAASQKGHPPGLFLLFTTEMWERMSYYGMRALLSLYLADKTRGGFGWNDEQTLALYGWYTGLVYLTPVAGGYLADRWIGQRRSVLIGGALMMIGQFLLAMPGLAFLYAGLGMLIIGNGFFKPNISTMVGGLYRQGDPRRDSAFTIFYMGINVGAMLSSFVCGTIGERVSWGAGFASAGVGMALGLVTFFTLANRLLGDVGKAPSESVSASAGSSGSIVNDDDSRPLTTEEIQRIAVIVILSAFVIIFWAGFEQAGGLMNLYTERKIDRVVFGWEVPTTWFQAVNAIFIVGLGLPFAAMWTALGRRGKDPSSPTKMGLGLLLLGAGFVLMLGAVNQAAAQGKAHMFWIIGAYLLHTMGELCLSPIGLSMVTKLAPKRYASLLMGIWFLSNAAANKLAGTIGGQASKLGEYTIFGGIAATTAAAGLVLLAISPVLKRMMHGADSVTSEPVAQEAGGDAVAMRAAEKPTTV